jgi:hypothetical protein
MATRSGRTGSCQDSWWNSTTSGASGIEPGLPDQRYAQDAGAGADKVETKPQAATEDRGKTSGSAHALASGGRSRAHRSRGPTLAALPMSTLRRSLDAEVRKR